MDAQSLPLSSREKWLAGMRWLGTLPVNTSATLMLCVTLVGAPFLFGSRELVTVSSWCLWLGAASVVASPARMRRPHLRLVFGLATIVAGYGIVLHEQVSSHPWLASPHPIWAQASQALGGDALPPSVSIARNASFYNLGTVVANVLALLVGLVVGTDRRLARRVLLVTAWAGAVFAAYGIFADLFTPTSILWREKSAYVGSVTGTFVNRNTAATYFGSMATIWLLFLLEAIRDHMPHGPLRWKTVWKQSLFRIRRETMIPFGLFFVCLAALFMTQSRGGVIFTLGAMLMVFWLSFHRDLIGRGNRVVTILAAVLVSLVVLQILSGVIAHRLDTQGLTDLGRLTTYRSTLRMIEARPWFGTGIGTFVWSFPTFRDGETSMYGTWDLAHSTPLQMASEVGIPLTVIVGAAWVVALVILVRAIFIRRRDTVIPLAALAVSVIALTHSMIDFSLQIAGYSIVVFGVLGVGLAQSFRSPAGHAEDQADATAGSTRSGVRRAPSGMHRHRSRSS